MNIEDQIIGIIEKVTGTKVSASDSLIDNNLLDSISVVDLTIELEEQFGIKIKAFEAKNENYGDVQSIAKFVMSKKTSV